MTMAIEDVKYEDCKYVYIKFVGGEELELSLDPQEYDSLIEAIDCNNELDYLEIDSWNWTTNWKPKGESIESNTPTRTTDGYCTYHLNLNNIAYVQHWQE